MSSEQTVALQRYPIDALDRPADRALVKRCRAALATPGACELPGFLEPEAVARVLEEVAPLRAAYTRIEKSPYHYGSRRHGVALYSFYNHHHHPRHYGDPIAEDWQLLEGVTLWDVLLDRGDADRRRMRHCQ